MEGSVINTRIDRNKRKILFGLTYAQSIANWRKIAEDF